jgi:hypothetical protein
MKILPRGILVQRTGAMFTTNTLDARKGNPKSIAMSDRYNKVTAKFRAPDFWSVKYLTTGHNALDRDRGNIPAWK